MGGEDWQMWMEALQNADVLADGATTVAYSYIGPEITHAVYREGTIGRAKDHLESSAGIIGNQLKALDGRAFVSINKAVVTQSSSAVPVVPLYISLLYKVMKQKGIHEGTIEQMYRLFSERLYSKLALDESGRIRVDDLEMREDVQGEISDMWKRVDTENIEALSDIIGYRDDFFKLFGFGLPHIDYDDDVDVNVDILNIIQPV
jgi:enoyl-[acyl-carrier protein] reductase/trans-2-enoyl-CoA reductase (NAD+)